MRLLRLAVVLFAFGALGAFGGCGGGDDGGGAGNIDAPVVPPIDAPAAKLCTGANYDPCTANTQCMSNNCHFYQAQNLQVCVSTCTPGNNLTCPVDKTGANGMCNNMGICRPAAANDCTR